MLTRVSAGLTKAEAVVVELILGAGEAAVTEISHPRVNDDLMELLVGA